jgi:protein-S-isoprenylcysteine O-methyltransferase Ste14
MKQMRILAMAAGILALLLGFTTVFQNMVQGPNASSAVFDTTRQLANTSIELTQFAILIVGAAIVLFGVRELTRAF